MISARCYPITLRCACCNLIWGKETWLPERRREAVQYTHGICRDCRARYFTLSPPPPTRQNGVNPDSIRELL